MSQYRFNIDDIIKDNDGDDILNAVFQSDTDDEPVLPKSFLLI
jgi:hypothetical protein